jgi:hypothetical protein
MLYFRYWVDDCVLERGPFGVFQFCIIQQTVSYNFE